MSTGEKREERMDQLVGRVREAYNVPPSTPREAMWSEIEARLGARGAYAVDLDEERRRRTPPARAAIGWAAAAAAVLFLGIGIGRMTAPAGAPEVAEGELAGPTALGYAAAEHLERSDMLLRMVRSDAREGGLDPATRRWARGLLVETRLLLDAGGVADDAPLARLLEDIELVLVQIVGAAEGEGRARNELGLALREIEESDVLARIQAVTPVRLAGT